jgi:hypothetical protein
MAPPLDPPVEGGLPLDLAEDFADDWWGDDPYYALGLMWDAYCGMLGPPAGGISHVQTGAQAVSYSPPMATGEGATACAKAQWYFSRSIHGAGGLASVPLARSFEGIADDEPIDWWQRDLDEEP